MNKERIFTGLLDKDLNKIYYGDYILVGMRRGDFSGFSREKVARGVDGLPCLENQNERMQMQWDQELRQLIIKNK